MDTVKDNLISIVLMIDDFIYTFIASVYDLIRKLAEMDIFSADAINGFARNVYALIGIFMLFKLTFSMISYLVNPDEFSDKSKGFGSLIKNIIMALVLIVAVPYLFSEAYYVQRMILNDSTLEKLVFYIDKDGKGDKSDYSYIDDAGRDIQFTLFSQFVKPNDSISACKHLYAYENNKRVIVEGTKNTGKLNTNCEEALDEIANSSNNKNAGQTITYYKEAMKHRSFDILVNHSEIYTLTYSKSADALDNDDTVNVSNKIQVIKYNWFVSTIVGIVVLLMLITICMDVAVRSVKLAFYQLIAPIPIIASVAPNGKKDSMLQKWFKACVSTYLDLFIRLFGLYMGVFVIREVTNNFQFDGLASIIVIIGMLIFAKQLPKIINDITGLKFDGFTLNPFKKVGDEALGGKQIISTGKKTVGTTAGLATGVAAGIAGAMTGKGFHAKSIAAGISSGFKGDKLNKVFASSYAAGAKRHNELQRMRADGVKPHQIVGENIRTAFGRESNAERVQNLVNQGKAIGSAYDAIKNQLVSCDSNDNLDGVAGRSAKTIAKSLDELKKTSIDLQSFRDQAQQTVVNSMRNDLEKQARSFKVSNPNDKRTVDEIVNENLKKRSSDIAAATNTEMQRLYSDAIDQQRKRVKDMEGELEARINAVANKLVTDSSFSVGVASADKIVREQTDLMNKLVESTNKLGKSIDDGYAEITAANNDVVNIMKQGKGVVAQASSGKMAQLTDIGKYTNGSKK